MCAIPSKRSSKKTSPDARRSSDERTRRRPRRPPPPRGPIAGDEAGRRGSLAAAVASVLSCWVGPKGIFVVRVGVEVTLDVGSIHDNATQVSELAQRIVLHKLVVN